MIGQFFSTCTRSAYYLVVGGDDLKCCDVIRVNSNGYEVSTYTGWDLEGYAPVPRDEALPLFQKAIEDLITKMEAVL